MVVTSEFLREWKAILDVVLVERTTLENLAFKSLKDNPALFEVADWTLWGTNEFHDFYVFKWNTNTEVEVESSVYFFEIRGE